MKLMIVDDNREMRLFLRNLFELRAENIIECPNGKCAVELYDLHHPDYVLMDIEMKGMDGLTATERIISANPEAKIIIVTSHDNPTLNKATGLLGAIAFVSKDNLFELENIIND